MRKLGKEWCRTIGLCSGRSASYRAALWLTFRSGPSYFPRPSAALESFFLAPLWMDTRNHSSLSLSASYGTRQVRKVQWSERRGKEVNGRYDPPRSGSHDACMSAPAFFILTFSVVCTFHDLYYILSRAVLFLRTSYMYCQWCSCLSPNMLTALHEHRRQYAPNPDHLPHLDRNQKRSR